MGRFKVILIVLILLSLSPAKQANFDPLVRITLSIVYAYDGYLNNQSGQCFDSVDNVFSASLRNLLYELVPTCDFAYPHG